MVMLVYSVWDRKLSEFGHLVLAKNDEAIRRTLIDSVQGSGTLMEKHPEDFDLMCVGAYDQEQGRLKAPEGPPVLVFNVGDLLAVHLVKEA